MLSYRLGFIGAGNMAEAVVRGLRQAELLPRENIAVSDPSDQRRSLFRDQLDVAVVATNAALVARSDVVVLAVKPQMIDTVLAEVGPLLDPAKLVVSIVAGVTLSRLARFCPAGTRLVRTMPNTPMLVGRGMVALARGPDATSDDAELVRELFATGATVIEVPEEKLDAVTAVSGSGPAYFFLLVEALASAGVAAGLSAQEAATLARTTFIGAAELLASGDLDPAELRRRVTSPGGTTAAAIESFTRDDFQGLITRAVASAAARSRELGR
jgi:pyrroline-5-carboxylate reductase